MPGNSVEVKLGASVSQAIALSNREIVLHCHLVASIGNDIPFCVAIKFSRLFTICGVARLEQWGFSVPNIVATVIIFASVQLLLHLRQTRLSIK